MSKCPMLAPLTSHLCRGQHGGPRGTAGHSEACRQGLVSCGELQGRGVGDCGSHAGNGLSSPGMEHRMLLR